MNAITVGSIDYNKNISSFSSWDTDNNYLYKPDLVAPGGRMSSVPNLSGSYDGTSFAAPMVTGIIALLMEEFPVLKLNPVLLKSALHLGCEFLPTQTNYFDQQSGFGLVNYENTREYLNNSNYSNFNIPTYANNGDIILSYNVSIPSNNKIEININWLINSVEANINTNSHTPNYTKCKVQIYDIQKQKYMRYDETISNLGYLSYANPSDSTRTYRLDIRLTSSKETDIVEVGALAYRIISQLHEHDYSYTILQYNEAEHKSICGCGEYVLRPHVVSASVVGRYKPCIECGYLVDTYTQIVIIEALGVQKTRISANGSYILPNGVIVLVDEDIDLYYKGLLVFYTNGGIIK